MFGIIVSHFNCCLCLCLQRLLEDSSVTSVHVLYPSDSNPSLLAKLANLQSNGEMLMDFCDVVETPLNVAQLQNDA